MAYILSIVIYINIIAEIKYENNIEISSGQSFSHVTNASSVSQSSCLSKIFLIWITILLLYFEPISEFAKYVVFLRLH